MEKSKKGFNLDDIAKATSWSESTVRTYISKKWDKIIKRIGSQYFVVGVLLYTEDEYVKLMSQVNRYSSNPHKPDLPTEAERMVIKARESSLLALDIFNRPATTFKTEGFIVMMFIAWTALFHAIFEIRGISYYYCKDDGDFEYKDGDKKAWELSTCISEYFGTVTSPIKENLKFFIGLRNKIEHRYVPDLDPYVSGECQSLLLNFDELMTHEFGTYYALRETLAVPLQTATLRTPNQIDTLKKFQGRQFNKLKEYIDAFRNDLPNEIYDDPKFSFRVYLIPKCGNHKSSSDITIEFIKYDPNNPDDMGKLEKLTTLIKEKKVQVANQGKFKPSTVTKIVSEKIKKKFTIYNHTQAWKLYDARKQGNSPDGCKYEYCQFDETHGDYIYTQEWINFLIKKLTDENEYNRLICYK